MEQKEIPSFRNMSFDERLVWVMLQRGFTSTRSNSGVDIKKLAETVGVSQEMGRRYVEGEAKPREKKQKMLEEWLDVNDGFLRGYNNNPFSENIKKPEAACLSDTKPKIADNSTSLNIVVSSYELLSSEDKKIFVNYIMDKMIENI